VRDRSFAAMRASSTVPAMTPRDDRGFRPEWVAIPPKRDADDTDRHALPLVVALCSSFAWCARKTPWLRRFLRGPAAVVAMMTLTEERTRLSPTA